MYVWLDCLIVEPPVPCWMNVSFNQPSTSPALDVVAVVAVA